MYLSGVSQGKIIEFLRADDPVRFEKQSHSGLKKMLLNKTAIGYWGETPNVYPPVIEESLFYSVQNEVKKRAGNHIQGNKTNHIMAGLVACELCGKNYSVRNQVHSTPVMYCTNSNKGNCDNKATFPLAVMNEFRIRTQIPYIKKILQNEVDSGNQKMVISLDGKIATIQENIDNLVVLVANGSDSAIKKVISLEKELKQLKLDRIGLVQTDATLSLDNLRQSGLDMSNDPLILNGMLKQSGYKIIANNKTIKIDQDQMVYLRYVYKSKDQSAGYEVSCFGQVDVINKTEDTDFAIDEQLNKLVKGMK